MKEKYFEEYVIKTLELITDFDFFIITQPLILMNVSLKFIIPSLKSMMIIKFNSSIYKMILISMKKSLKTSKTISLLNELLFIFYQFN